MGAGHLERARGPISHDPMSRDPIARGPIGYGAFARNRVSAWG